MIVETDNSFLVVDEGVNRDNVVRVDRATGNRTTVSDASSGDPLLVEPAALLIENDESLLVADVALDAILRVNRSSGDRVIMSGCSEEPDPCPVPLVGTGPEFMDPVDLLMESNGDIIVVDSQRVSLLRVNPLTGARSVVSGENVGGGPPFGQPRAAVSDGAGGWFVGDADQKAIFRVAFFTGFREIISDGNTGTGPVLDYPAGITRTPEGNLLVVDAFTGNLLQVNPTTGDRTLVSGTESPGIIVGAGPVFFIPVSVVAMSDGAWFVLDESLDGILEVNPVTGDRSFLSRAATLTITPASGLLLSGQPFNLTMLAIGSGNQVMNFEARLDGNDVTSALMPCLFAQSPQPPEPPEPPEPPQPPQPPQPPPAFQTLQTAASPVMLPGGGVGLSCPTADSLLNLSPGRHMFEVELTLFDDQTNMATSPVLRDDVVWEVYREQ
jgi:hypothetical protein